MGGGRRALRLSFVRYAAIRAIQRCHPPHEYIDRALLVCSRSCKSALADLDLKHRATHDILREAEWQSVVRSLCAIVCPIDYETTYEKFIARRYIIDDLARLCNHPRTVPMRREMGRCTSADWSNHRGRFAVFAHEVQELVETQNDW